MDVATLKAWRESPRVKDNLAAFLREEITSGCLAPGERIIEKKWAARLQVAQISVREALNTLAAEGFIEKSSGRSARVIQLTLQDMRHIYQLRVVLESLAARLVAECQADLGDLESALDDFDQAAARRDLRAVCESDLAFHLRLCEKSGNPFLAQHHRRLTVPLIGFSFIRGQANEEWKERWFCAGSEHREILLSLRSGDAFLAQHCAAYVLARFAHDTCEILERENVSLARTNHSEKRGGGE
jgi:DNA-binding GntR family transcriptional regulator